MIGPGREEPLEPPSNTSLQELLGWGRGPAPLDVSALSPRGSGLSGLAMGDGILFEFLEDAVSAGVLSRC